MKFFDSDEDGYLNYAEFLQFILPCDNTLLRAFASQKQSLAYIRKVGELLPDTIERELTTLLVMELDLHRQTEPLKQELKCAKDFSEDSLIACLDSWGYGFIDPKSIKFFFKQQQQSQIDNSLCAAIIRRFDLDGDSRLTHAEFIHGVTPMEPHSKVLVKEKIEAREMLEKLKESIK